MADIDEKLRHDLRDPEFSEGYAESFLDTYVATQLKVLREQRHLTQKEVAKNLRTSQGVVSRLEDADYASWNVNTLRKFARLYDVRLHISFETYGSLIGDMKRFGRKSLERAPRHADPVLYASPIRRRATAQFDEFQGQLFEDARQHTGANKPSAIATTLRAAIVKRPISQQPKAGANEKISYLSDHRSKQSGANALNKIGVASHAR
jgi:transcriptional regulator with XRE-family HTH domain